MTSFTAKDASGNTHTLATQTVGGLESFGAFTRALPEGGATPFRTLSLGATGQLVKNSFGSLFTLILGNADVVGSPPIGAVQLFVKLYDKATAPTDSDTPVMTIPVPAGQTVALSFAPALAFLTGIGMRCTPNVNDADSEDPPANAMVVNLTYN